MTESINIVIRPATPFDKNFILSTWLKGQYYGTRRFRHLSREIYFRSFADHITGVLGLPHICVHIACDVKHPEWIVGFAVFQTPNLYWVHVKKDFRKRGIANLLISGAGITTAKSETRVGRAIANKKGFVFNPI